ncbi:hypothetical protein BJ138DRAFT_1107334 [Hygrophoropsis aurantiaca]|uniref:Uncharacterized protein n=1 Tax=Hygrophoropsis aurantiaca TaxID=72124 RepID=A0ACB7ZRY5_9AGAM|nr:hypothetical protein BJ138DRAFT_1107334 [Hygrophoropsis aurantiaca]
MPNAIAELKVTNSQLASELQRRWKYLQSVNAYHIHRIQQIQYLPGYSGPVQAGVHVGRATEPSHFSLAGHDDERDNDPVDIDADDSMAQQMIALEGFLGSLDHHISDGIVS